MHSAESVRLLVIFDAPCELVAVSHRRLESSPGGMGDVRAVRHPKME